MSGDPQLRAGEETPSPTITTPDSGQDTGEQGDRPDPAETGAGRTRRMSSSAEIVEAARVEVAQAAQHSDGGGRGDDDPHHHRPASWPPQARCTETDDDRAGQPVNAAG